MPMTTADVTLAQPSALGFLDKERTIATAGFNRWLVPPAALCIHLCIGMAYGFSVFWLPLSRALGLSAPKAKAALFWAFVGLPLAWGVWKTLESAVKIL
jgi:hypothetical protein